MEANLPAFLFSAIPPMLESSVNFYGIAERRVKEREESIGDRMESFYEQSGID